MPAGRNFDELLACIRDVLTHVGRVSHDDASARAQLEYERISIERRELPSPVEPQFYEALDHVKRLEKQRTRDALGDGKTKPKSTFKGKKWWPRRFGFGQRCSPNRASPLRRDAI